MECRHIGSQGRSKRASTRKSEWNARARAKRRARQSTVASTAGEQANHIIFFCTHLLPTKGIPNYGLQNMAPADIATVSADFHTVSTDFDPLSTNSYTESTGFGHTLQTHLQNPSLPSSHCDGPPHQLPHVHQASSRVTCCLLLDPAARQVSSPMTASMRTSTTDNVSATSKARSCSCDSWETRSATSWGGIMPPKVSSSAFDPRSALRR